jgi:hypothetical protein
MVAFLDPPFRAGLVERPTADVDFSTSHAPRGAGRPSSRCPKTRKRSVLRLGLGLGEFGEGVAAGVGGG